MQVDHIIDASMFMDALMRRSEWPMRIRRYHRNGAESA